MTQEFVDERVLLKAIEERIRRDPARRGLIGTEPKFEPLCPGHLAQAAQNIVQTGAAVGIVTGFFIPHGQPPAAETDGPLGAVILADALQSLDISVRLITDELCHSALVAAAHAAGLPSDCVLGCPLQSAAWRKEFLASSFGRQLSHLIAVERVGPCHTVESLISQRRLATSAPVDEFRRLVPLQSCNRCHNMRGRPIDDCTGDLHELFEDIRVIRPTARTIGIGDGANEIGMGVIPWEELARRIGGSHGGRVPCRIETDWNILAGTSNWGGFALAAATLRLGGRIEVLQRWNAAFQQSVLEALIENGPAVDGVTGRREATVDGLPFPTYFQPCEAIIQLLGFE